jgi:5-methylcytosine-specific restriction endonuclease McrA
VIRLVDRTVEESEVPGVEIGIDPGSKFTGVSVFRVDDECRRDGLVAVEIKHRGQQIHGKMHQRSAYRRRRRTAKLRYRKPRWANRSPEACANCGKNARDKRRYCRPCASTRRFVDNGYRRHHVPPSLCHRVDSTMSMVLRLRRWMPVTAIHQELVRFDMQKLQNPEIAGVEYQQGTLLGYEVRAYLLEKWGRECAYCGKSGVPLQVEHIQAKSRGGTNRVSNLTLACDRCNDAKNNLPVEVFLADDPKRLARVLAQAKAPLTDAAAVNATRWALWRELVATGLPVETGSGGRTKWNRSRFGLEKSHTLDALCVGRVEGVASYPASVLAVEATGRGAYQRTKWLTARPCIHCGKSFSRPMKELLEPKTKAARQRSRCCFACRAARTFSDEGYRAKGRPWRYFGRAKVRHGFATGDLVRAVVPSGKHKGTHVGRVAVRSRPSFDVSGVGDVHPKYLRLLQRSDGWEWSVSRERRPPLLPALTDGVPAAER